MNYRMPNKPKSFWRGRGRTGYPEEKQYNGHDDRVGRPNNNMGFQCSQSTKFRINKPRVSFKQNYKPDQRKKNALIKQQLDDDVSMSSGSNNNNRQVVHRGRGKGFIRGRNSPLPPGNIRDGRPRLPNESNWYKVNIPQGQNYTKEFILGNLLSYIDPFTFTPIMYKIFENKVIFFVEDHKIAAKLADCNNKFITSDGHKMQVIVSSCFEPRTEISNVLKERLKQAMEKRYMQATNALNLSKFHHDPDLAADYWCPLARPDMLRAVLDIVQEHIPNLEALNLDSNKLIKTERLGFLADKFPKLKILHIGDNRIREVSHLNVFKNLQLDELRLEGNPVCNKYKNRQEDYVNDIRKTFPKLLKLDGIDLPPPIVFDVEDQKLKLPPTQRMYIIQSNAPAQDVASRFLEQYFTIFDSDNRQGLLVAYHENACFSMTTNIPASSSKFSQYLEESRNLYRVSDSNKRRKLLKQGRLPVVSFISEMPRTKHDLSSFTMDIPLFTDGMMMIIIVITGLFKELNNKDNKEIIRHFNRTFIIIPQGDGFCISNEQLHINNPTPNQEKQFNSVIPVTQPTPGPSTVPAPVSAVPITEEVKQQMIMALSQQTNMNIQYSLECLEANQWNIENAHAAYHAALTEGKISPAAFIK